MVFEPAESPSCGGANIGRSALRHRISRIRDNFYPAFFEELVLGCSTQQVGLLLAVSLVSGGIVAPFPGTWSGRFGPRSISLTRLILMVYGCSACSTFNTQLPEWRYLRLEHLP